MLALFLSLSLSLSPVCVCVCVCVCVGFSSLSLPHQLKEVSEICLGSPSLCCGLEIFSSGKLGHGAYLASLLSGITVLCCLLSNVLKNICSFFFPVFKLKQEGLISPCSPIIVKIGSLEYYISSARTGIFILSPNYFNLPEL